MERLTMIDGCGNDELVRCMDCSLEKAGENLENCGFCEEGWQKALKKLTAYEDTGLEPEDLALGLNAAVRRKAGAEYYGLSPDQMDVAVDLFRTDKDGRVVVLPCKIGGTMYTNISVHGDRYRKADRPYPVKVVYIGMGEGTSYFHGEYSNERVFPFDFDRIGKTVFLTREEAEAALRKPEEETT